MPCFYKVVQNAAHVEVVVDKLFHRAMLLGQLYREMIGLEWLSAYQFF